MDIFEFSGEHRYLSNFWIASFVWEGIRWPHSEAAYQAAKFPKESWQIFLDLSPEKAKKMGRNKGCRKDWTLVKVPIMKSIVREKFKQNPDLAQKLIATGSALLQEGNNWNDTFWGICPAKSGNGSNHLGKILMEIRTELSGDTVITPPSHQKQVIITYDF